MDDTPPTTFPEDLSSLQRRAEAALRRLETMQQTPETAELAGILGELCRHGMEFERLSLLARETDNAVIFTDAQRHVTWANEGFTRLAGYSADEILGKSMRIVQGPGTNPDTLARIRAALDAGRPFREQLLNYSKEGRPYWIDLQVQPLRDEHGNLTGFLGVQSEITEQRQRDEELVNFRTAIEQADVSIIIAKLDGTIGYVNPAFCRITGYTEDEAIGRTLPILNAGTQDEDFYRNLQSDLASGRSWTGTLQNRRKDGSLYWESAVFTPVRNADGVVDHYIAIKEDITHHREAELELQKQIAQMADLLGAATAVGIVGTDADGFITIFNPGAENLLGYHADEVIGKIRPLTFHHPEDLEEIRQQLADAGKPTDARSMLVALVERTSESVTHQRLVRKDGTTLIVALRTHTQTNGGFMGILIDVTQQERAVSQLEHSEKMLQRAESVAQLGSWEFDLITKTPRWSAECCRIHEVPEDTEPSLIDALGFYPEPGRSELAAALEKCAEDGSDYEMELPFVTAKGNALWVRVISRTIFDGDRPVLLTGIIQNITERKLAELTLREKTEELARTNARLEELAAVFTYAHEGILITDTAGTIREINEAFTRITGYTRGDAIGKNHTLLSSGRHTEEFFLGIYARVEEVGYWSGEVWNRRKSGEIYPQKVTVSGVRDEHGHIHRWVSVFTDVTEEERNARQLEYVAQFDSLTGLPNRQMLGQQLEVLMARCREHKRQLAMVFIDLDGFKAVNETLGNQAGDRVLCEVGRRLKEFRRPGETAARIGGDELVVVFCDLESEEAAPPRLDELLKILQMPYEAEGQPVHLTASLGVSLYPQPEEVAPDQLVRQADLAMYQAKLSGKNRYHFFNPGEDLATRRFHESLQRVRRGLEDGEFLLHYQPKVNMRTGKVAGVEALVRWNHPERGLLLPAQFLPLVEDHPFALEFGDWVLEAALRQLVRWQSEGLELVLNVNVFARQLLQEDFPERLQASLSRHPSLRPDMLEIEVLESSALKDIPRASALITACQRLGISCALDDFGTGYSTLAYLKQLPARTLKIDQSFVRSMLDDPEDLAILNGILGLSRIFRRQPVAEGIETTAHGEILLDFGCELAQGFGIGRPMPGEEVVAWATRWKPGRTWLARPEKSQEQMQLIFTAVEHRAWFSQISRHIEHGEDAPALDLETCGFGRWLEGQKDLFRDYPLQAAALLHSHAEVHACADKLVATRQEGKLSEARERLRLFERLRDDLLAQLSAVSEIYDHLPPSPNRS